MRVLLDECIDEALRHGIAGHDCQTCRYAGLKGITNGQLLAAAEQSGFQVLITVDRNLQYQQRLHDRKIALVILEGRTTNLDDLLVLVPDILTALEALKSGDVVRVGNHWRE
jgi:predicted nuclease of predicted toxin-antitoxin system